jgi:hypothetical protein
MSGSRQLNLNSKTRMVRAIAEIIHSRSRPFNDKIQRSIKPARDALPAMPRLLPSEECPKCHGPMKRTPSMLGAVYTCAHCDADDPLDDVKRWLGSELTPPASGNAADR